jgi:hypothetical protein
MAEGMGPLPDIQVTGFRLHLPFPLRYSLLCVDFFKHLWVFSRNWQGLNGKQTLFSKQTYISPAKPT